MLLIITALICSMCQSQLSQAITFQDGVNADILPSFYSVNGNNGIRVPLGDRNIGEIDYFIRMWIRWNDQSYLTQTTQNIFEIEQSLSCGLNWDQFLDSLSLICNSTTTHSTMGLQSSNYPRSKFWVHLAVGGSVSQQKTYIRLDYKNAVLQTETNSAYVSLKQQTIPWYAYLGNNRLISTQGFIGDLREFYFIQQYVEPTMVQHITHSIFSWTALQIAYYRLRNGDLSDSMLPMKGQLLNSTNILPTFSFESLPNDMCYAYTDSTQLPLLGPEASRTFTLPRYSREDKNFAYTFSVWMKTLPGITPAPSKIAGKKTHFFFRLEESFSVYFDTSNSIKTYFMALSNFYEQQSSAIFVPSNQWVNLQITIHYTQGYQARTYNIQRQMTGSLDQKMFYEGQLPTGQVTLFNNFKGYVKSLVLYQTKLALPIQMPLGVSETVNDGSLLLYYKLDSQNFQGTVLKSLAQGGPDVDLGAITFASVDFSEIPFNKPSTNGTVKQNQSQFDGVACIEQINTLQALKLSSSATYELNQFNSTLGEATLEFWFKQPLTVNSRTYMIQLYDKNTKLNYMTVTQDSDQKYKCVPLGSQTTVSLDLQFAKGSNQKWQHVSCAFNSRETAKLVMFRDGDPKYSSQQVSLDLRSTTSFVIPNAQYTLILGPNSPQQSADINTLYKDVRLWKTSRSITQILNFRYRQVDPLVQNNMVAYFRLMSGIQSTVNFPGIDNQTVGLNLTNFASNTEDSNHRVCPLYSYYSDIDGGCYLSPFLIFNVVFLPSFNNNTNKITYQIISKPSQLVSSTDYDELSFTWSTTHQALMGRTVSQQKSLTDLTLNDLADLTDYQFNLQITNSKKTFMLEKQLNVNVESCRYLRDQISGKAWTDLIISDVAPGERDIPFTLQEFPNPTKICSEYTTLKGEIVWDISPQGVFTKVVPTAQSQDKSFQFKIAAVDQTTLKIGEVINLVGTVTWQSAAGKETFLNVVYRLQFVTPVTPVIETNNVTSIIIGETLTLDGSQSFINGSTVEDSASQLSYYWVCPPFLSESCKGINTSPTFTLSYTAFELSGEVFGNHSFSLIVYKSGETFSEFMTKATVWIEYADIAFPLYQMNPRNGKTVASQTTIIDVEFLTYDPRDPNLKFDLLIGPKDKINGGYLQAGYHTELYLMKGILNQNQKYNISFIGYDQRYPQTKSTSTILFTTGTIPVIKDLQINPTVGTAMETAFTFEVSTSSSLISPSNLFYSLYAFSEEGDDKFPITSSLISISQPFISSLPKLSNITVELIDITTNETAVLTKTGISVDFNENLKGQVGPNVQLFLKEPDLAIQVQKLSGFLFSIDQNTTDLVTIIDILDTKLTVANSMANRIANIAATESAANTSQIFQTIAKLVPYLTVKKLTMNDTISTQSYNILNAISKKTDAFDLAIQNLTFAEDMLRSVSNLYEYLNMKIELKMAAAKDTEGKRNLQEGDTDLPLETYQLNIANLLTMKDLISRKLCSTTQSGQRKFLHQPAFNLVVEQVRVNGEARYISQFADDLKSYVALPFADMVKNVEGSIQGDLCVIGSFLKVNPLVGYEFVNQTEVSDYIIEQQILDSSGNQLGVSQKVGNLTKNVTYYFHYDYNQTENEATMFRNGQTVCMAINNLDKNYAEKSWSNNTCHTRHFGAFNLMQCQCEVIAPQYVAIITDLSRELIADGQICIPGVNICASLQDFEKIAAAVLVFLIVYLIAMPLIAISKDRKDYKQIKIDTENYNEDLVKKIALFRRQPVDQILYKFRLINETKKSENIGCCFRTKIYCRHLHPFFGIFCNFDFRYKRLTRQMVVLFQLCLIALISALYFTLNYRMLEGQDTAEDYDGRENTVDDTDKLNGVIAGLVLSILTLPPCSCFTSCFKARIVSFKDVDEEYQKEGGESSDDSEPQQKPKKKSRKSDSKKKEKEKEKKPKKPKGDRAKAYQVHQYSQGDVEAYINSPPLAIDSCIPCKVLLLMCSVLFCLATILVCALKNAEHKTVMSQTGAFVLAFYVAILFGWFILNYLRVFVNAMLVSSVVESEDQNLIDGNGSVASGCARIMDVLFVSEDAKEIYRDMVAITSPEQYNIRGDEENQMYQPQPKPESENTDNSSGSPPSKPPKAGKSKGKSHHGKRNKRIERYQDENGSLKITN